MTGDRLYTKFTQREDIGLYRIKYREWEGEGWGEGALIGVLEEEDDEGEDGGGGRGGRRVAKDVYGEGSQRDIVPKR